MPIKNVHSIAKNVLAWGEKFFSAQEINYVINSHANTSVK